MTQPDRISVVVINNEPGIMAFLIEVFSALPCEVRSYVSAPAALAALGERPADIVVLDWYNPPLDGPPLFSCLRRAHPKTVIVYVSPHADEIPTALEPTLRAPELIIETPFVPARVVEQLRALVLGFF